jgi:uncharacterized RDD family membrane protein YckC
MKIDTVALVETPEGTDLHADLAGLVPRTLAYAIDLLIRVGIMCVLGLLMLFLGEVGMGITLIVFFVLEWWYPVLFEVYRGGQTWGKKIFNIKVVNDDLTPVALGPSLTRNLLRGADIFPMFYATGCISILATKRFQRLGDLAAGTIVVYCETELYDRTSLEQVEAVTPVHAMSEDQQVAFINFALNKGRMSNDRQQEIAEIIRPRMPLNTSNASDYVRGVGKWLLGAR